MTKGKRARCAKKAGAAWMACALLLGMLPVGVSAAGETDAEAAVETEVAAETEAGAETNVDTETEPATEAETDAEAEIVVEVETAATGEAAGETETSVDTETEPATEAEVVVEAETASGGLQSDAQAHGVDAQAPATQGASVEEKGAIAPIGSAEKLYQLLKERADQMALWRMPMDVDGYSMSDMAGAVQENSAAPMETGEAADVSGDFSQTNLRETGVEEGDLVKTDGAYLYLQKRDSSVKIVRADGREMELLATLAPQDLSERVCDLYVSGDTLVLITGGSKTSLEETQEDVYETKGYDYAKAEVYDIAERTSPRLVGQMEQEGSYRSSRMVGDKLYLFTQYLPRIAQTYGDSEIMPLVNGTAINADDVFVPERLEDTDYLVIGSVDVKDPAKAISHKAVVSGAANFYVSASSIFIYNQDYTTGEQKTEILKFSYEDGQVEAVGACDILGYLNDTFSIDEYAGHLRVVATRWDAENINSLYVFNEKLELVGKIDDIAPGETIRSARFLGDTGYFVTFRNTDPLFSVDLSDPANPVILGALKVSGFSSYLHFYGENQLLGIGYEADPKTGFTTGVKLSMFDITDPSDVKERKRFVIKDAQSVPALSNYKAVCVSEKKNVIGFVCDDNYLVFSYDADAGFENLLTYSLSEGEWKNSGYWYEYQDVRGTYIADTFYLTDADAIRAFDMEKEYALEAKLEL